MDRGTTTLKCLLPHNLHWLGTIICLLCLVPWISFSWIVYHYPNIYYFLCFIRMAWMSTNIWLGFFNASPLDSAAVILQGPEWPRFHLFTFTLTHKGYSGQISSTFMHLTVALYLHNVIPRYDILILRTKKDLKSVCRNIWSSEANSIKRWIIFHYNKVRMMHAI